MSGEMTNPEAKPSCTHGWTDYRYCTVCMEHYILELECALTEARREYEGPMAEEIQALKRELAEAKAITKGFDELMRRLYNDMPLLPCPDYSQDVAFIAHGTMSWRKEANQRAKDRDEAHSQLDEAHAAIRALDEASETFARCEHASGCGAKCRCGAWEERNEARANLYRAKREHAPAIRRASSRESMEGK